MLGPAGGGPQAADPAVGAHFVRRPRQQHQERPPRFRVGAGIQRQPRRPAAGAGRPTARRSRTSGLAGDAPLTWIVCGRTSSVNGPPAVSAAVSSVSRPSVEPIAGCPPGRATPRGAPPCRRARTPRAAGPSDRRAWGGRLLPSRLHVLRADRCSPLPGPPPRPPPSVKSPRPSGSHVLTSIDSSSSAPSLSRTIFTCGRNGSEGCSWVTTPISLGLQAHQRADRIHARSG